MNHIQPGTRAVNEGIKYSLYYFEMTKHEIKELSPGSIYTSSSTCICLMCNFRTAILT